MRYDEALAPTRSDIGWVGKGMKVVDGGRNATTQSPSGLA